MSQHNPFETPWMPSIDVHDLQEFFENHRIFNDEDRNVFRRFQEIQNLQERIEPDELIELNDAVDYFRYRKNLIMDSRTPMSRDDEFKLRNILNRIQTTLWNILNIRRPLEAKEIQGTPAAESFADAYNAEASIVKSTEDVIHDIEAYKEQLLLTNTRLTKKTLSLKERRELESDKQNAEEWIEKYSAILDKRPGEL